MLLPATPGWVSLPVVVGGPRHSWLGSAGGGGVWCVAVVCWLLVPRHSWRRFLCATPRHSWLGFAAGGGAWCAVCGVRCVVCGVWRAAVACVVGLWLVWWVPRHSWRRFLCATPRHSWLGFAAGGGGRSPPLLAGVRWRRWCVVCGGGVLVVGPSPLLAEVPVCYSPPLLAGFRCRWWWAVPATPGWGPLAAVVCGVWRWCVGCWSLATPGGGSCVLLPATPGWVSLPAVVRGVRCVVCGVWRAACGGGVCGGFVAGVVGPSPLLAEVPVCYSPPLLAGFRCRWWWAVPATPGWGPLAAVVCGVWRWCVGCWSLATPGGGSCVLLPATPGWVSLPAVVRGVRCVVCGVWRAAVACVVGLWLVWLVPRHSWRRFLCATPRHSWLGFAAGGGGRSPPLLAGVRWRRWCVVCGGGVLVVGPSPLLAEVPVCYSPPLLAGFRCRWWWAVPATPGWGPLAAVVCGVWRWCVGCWSLATPGWVSLSAVVRGVRCVVCGVWRAAVACVVGLWLVGLVPRHSWRRFLCATPRHSWLGFAAGGGVVWCCGGCVFRVPFPLALVCVCALCGPSCWCGWRGGGGVALGVAVVRARACARGVWLVGWGVSYLGWFSSSVVGMFQKAEEEVL